MKTTNSLPGPDSAHFKNKKNKTVKRLNLYMEQNHMKGMKMCLGLKNVNRQRGSLMYYWNYGSGEETKRLKITCDCLPQPLSTSEVSPVKIFIR